MSPPSERGRELRLTSPADRSEKNAVPVNNTTPVKERTFEPNRAGPNLHQVNVPVPKSFLVDLLPGQQNIEVVQHCRASQGALFMKNSHSQKLSPILPRNLNVHQGCENVRAEAPTTSRTDVPKISDVNSLQNRFPAASLSTQAVKVTKIPRCQAVNLKSQNFAKGSSEIQNKSYKRQLPEKVCEESDPNFSRSKTYVVKDHNVLTVSSYTKILPDNIQHMQVAVVLDDILNKESDPVSDKGAAVQEPQPSKFQLLCEAASAARKVLKEQEAKKMQKKKRGYTNGGGPSSQEEIIVPRPAVGVVIGKNGDMIKRIQQDSGARVQFIQGKEDIPGDKLCQITGTMDQVQKASSLIRDLIQSVMVRDQQMGGGGGGAPGGNMGMAGRGRGRGRGGMGGGPGIRPDFGPGGPRMGRPGGNEGGTEVQFAVPANKCGLVIGKGGETVRNINQQTGAHVEIARGAPPNPHEKIFIIRGNPQQIEHAKQLIMELVGGMPPGQGGPPGGHNMPGGPQGQYPGPPQYQQQ